MSQHTHIELCTVQRPHFAHTRHSIPMSQHARIELCTVCPHSTHTSHSIPMSHPLANTQVYLGPLPTIKTPNNVAQRQFATDHRERNIKTYQISEDRLVVVKKNLVTIKQKDLDTSYEFTPSRLVLHTFVIKYCISLVCIEQCEFAKFHILFSFPVSSLTSYVRLSRRWACFCQSLTEINIAVQQLDEVDREVKLCSHVGGVPILEPYRKRLKRCAGCMSEFLQDPPTFVVSKREWHTYFYAGRRCLSWRKMFYHYRTSCIIRRHPDIDIAKVVVVVTLV